MSKKHHEDVARSEFHDWLCSQFPLRRIEWLDVPTSQPRPDWYLSLDESTYAVEATSVVPNVNQGRYSVLEPSISSAISEFVDSIQQEAIDQGVLRGAYAIALGPIPNNDVLRNRITGTTLDYIRRTRDEPRADPATIDQVGDIEIVVQKLHPFHSYLTEWINLGDRPIAEVISDLRSKLTSSLERKASLYREFDVPVILLILDGFHIVEPQEWVRSAAPSSAAMHFDAVFRIKPATPPLLLAARNELWKRYGRDYLPAA